MNSVLSCSFCSFLVRVGLIPSPQFGHRLQRATHPLLFGGSPAFLMTSPRTAAHEETELLTVLKIPFHSVSSADPRYRSTKSVSAVTGNAILSMFKRLEVFHSPSVWRWRMLSRSLSPGQADQKQGADFHWVREEGFGDCFFLMFEARKSPHHIRLRLRKTPRRPGVSELSIAVLRSSEQFVLN
jgi:hypothetical protein